MYTHIVEKPYRINIVICYRNWSQMKNSNRLWANQCKTVEHFVFSVAMYTMGKYTWLAANFIKFKYSKFSCVSMNSQWAAILWSHLIFAHYLYFCSTIASTDYFISNVDMLYITISVLSRLTGIHIITWSCDKIYNKHC